MCTYHWQSNFLRYRLWSSVGYLPYNQLVMYLKMQKWSDCPGAKKKKNKESSLYEALEKYTKIVKKKTNFLIVRLILEQFNIIQTFGNTRD